MDFDSESDDDFLSNESSGDENSEVDPEKNTERQQGIPQGEPLLEEITWESNSQSMIFLRFTKAENFVAPVTGNNSIDHFMHILTNNFLHEIVTQTNSYAVEFFFGLM